MLVRSDGEIVDGHLRLKAARKLGMTEVPIIRCDEWSAAQVKAFRLMVNRSATWAEWDEELLAIEFGELAELNFEPTSTGFDPREIDIFMGAYDAGDNAQLDSVAELPENPVSRRGDLWLCGNHRVLCGDCTSPYSVVRLLTTRGFVGYIKKGATTDKSPQHREKIAPASIPVDETQSPFEP
jgi:ParB-like chromosome segregation protein Spo0J